MKKIINGKEYNMMTEEELERIKREAFEKGVSSVWSEIVKVTPRQGDYNCLYNAVHGMKNYPNGFNVEIDAVDY